MTTSAADDPYLRVVSEFDAATTPAPTHQPVILALLAGIVSRVALAHRRQHPRRRRASVGHGGDSDSSVVGQRHNGSSPTGPVVRQGKARRRIHHTTREDEV
jgi:hypothetical protein